MGALLDPHQKTRMYPTRPSDRRLYADAIRVDVFGVRAEDDGMFPLSAFIHEPRKPPFPVLWLNVNRATAHYLLAPPRPRGPASISVSASAGRREAGGSSQPERPEVVGHLARRAGSFREYGTKAIALADGKKMLKRLRQVFREPPFFRAESRYNPPMSARKLSAMETTKQSRRMNSNILFRHGQTMASTTRATCYEVI